MRDQRSLGLFSRSHKNKLLYKGSLDACCALNPPGMLLALPVWNSMGSPGTPLSPFWNPWVPLRTLWSPFGNPYGSLEHLLFPFWNTYNPVLKKLEFFMLGQNGAFKIDSRQTTHESKHGPPLSKDRLFWKIPAPPSISSLFKSVTRNPKSLTWSYLGLVTTENSSFSWPPCKGPLT